jgi:hypothetical protein
MRVILVGAPDTGKSNLAQELHQALKARDVILVVSGSSNDYMATFGKAVGLLADYRVELSLAVRRAMAMSDIGNAIFEGTLLDNVAHAAAKYKRLLEDGGDEEVAYTQWLTMTLCAKMVRDTWKSDYIIYIHPSDAEPFKADVNEGLLTMLRELNLDYDYDVYEDDLRDETMSATIVDKIAEEICERAREKGTDQQTNE